MNDINDLAKNSCNQLQNKLTTLHAVFCYSILKLLINDFRQVHLC